MSASHNMSNDVKRLVRFEDVYLLHFDSHGKPIWVPRYAAQDMGSAKRASNAAKQARKYEGEDAPIVVVRVANRYARLVAAARRVILAIPVSEAAKLTEAAVVELSAMAALLPDPEAL